jgi:hypothetical protein
LIKPGTVVYATGDCRDGIEDARAWLREKNLTPADVRLYRADGMVLVEAVRGVQISPTAPQ